MKEDLVTNINLAVVGAKGSGKSALTVRFLTRRFIGEYDSHADVCITRSMEIAGRNTELHIKDTVGCDWLKGPSALIGWSSAIVIVYSVTDIRSFDLVTFILQNLNIGKRLDPGCILLLGNKNDLEHLRTVSHDDGKQLAKHYGVHFAETSAANDSHGVDSAFRRILFEALSAQVSRLNVLGSSSSESINGGSRKLSTVIRDRPERRSLRRVTRSTLTDSHYSIRDSLSSTSDDERISLANIDATLKSSPQSSPSSSPTPSAGKRRKISLPVLFEKIGRHNKTQKYLFSKVR